jgi:superfamily I DNA/RNA helicase
MEMFGAGSEDSRFDKLSANGGAGSPFDALSANGGATSEDSPFDRLRANGGGSITQVRHDSPFHLAAWLTDQLRGLSAQDPTASIAIIARSAEGARSLERVLRHGANPRLALGGEFEFRPGLTVTCVQEVKGLEFDHVILPDASSSTYPDTAESRRALYVAVTRATHRLGLLSAGPPSSLLGER